MSLILFLAQMVISARKREEISTKKYKKTNKTEKIVEKAKKLITPSKRNNKAYNLSSNHLNSYPLDNNFPDITRYF